jgi:hypothetical protein
MASENVLSLTHVNIKINNLGEGVEAEHLEYNSSNAKTEPDVSI